MVEDLEGSRRAKERLRAMVETLTGEKTVVAACAEVGLSEARFYEERRHMLQEAVESLEPRRMGRPRKKEPVSEEELVALRTRVAELELELKAREIREEIALAMPEVARRRAEKKTRHRRRP